MTAFIGDDDIHVTFAAVGRAITRWEALELALANIYAVFLVGSFSLDKIREFGAQNRIFASRLSALKRVATSYFHTHPDQQNEGDFAMLCDRAERLSEIRNTIAHGIVGKVSYLVKPGTWPLEYSDGPTLAMLQTPWYARDRQKLIGQDGMGSTEILAASEPFKALALDVDAYGLRFTPA